MKNVAIFMSSTFNDMQSERDLIRERVTPEIAETLAVYGRSVEFIDLRWGIDTASVDENVANRKILRTCFEEIKNSDPFFVAFLGERYGWIPDYDDVISALENEGIPTDGDIAGKSVTELEIECAARLNPIMDKTVFYFRDDVDYGTDREHADMFVSRGEEREKLNALKARLAKKYPDRVRTYKATWNAEQRRIEGLDDLERQVITDVKNIIVQDASIVRALDPKEESVNVIDGTVAALASSFSGRVSEREQIREFVRGDGRMLVLSGQSGSGKSALLAKAATECEDDGVVVLPFFVGADERCGTAESMMRLTVFRAARLLGLDDNVELGGEKLAQKFAFLLNRLALDKTVILIVDAINQFAPTEYENKLKWLNLYALSPRVKVIMSATSDYYGLSFLRALGAKIQYLDYFSESDVRAVSERYFTVNHKQASDKLLSAIVQKDGKPCRQPIYLLSLLQQLNNLGREDFAKIKDREKNSDESAADAIVNYLVDTVVTAPSELGNQLDRLLDAACEKAGDVCRLFVNAIALSRRGITERLMESVCKTLHADFDGATFSYFRRMFKTNLVRRENGAWDFSHALVKSHYCARVNGETAKAIVGAVIESLTAEPDDAMFKRTEYAFYLTAADRLDLFVPFLANNDCDTTRQSLTYELREKRNADRAQKLFAEPQYAETVRRFVVDTVSSGAYSPELAEKYCYYALKAVYEDGEYNADITALSAACDIYRAVGAVGMSSGYYRIARDYLLLAKRTAEKTGGSKADILSRLSECYFALGVGLKSGRYGKLAVKALEDEYARGEVPAAKLLEAYIAECERVLRAVIVSRKRIAELIDKCRPLLTEISDECEKRAYAAKLLLCVAKVNICADDLNRIARDCENDDGRAFIKYALGAYLLNTSVGEGLAQLNEAQALAVDALKVDVNVDTLKLLDRICELKIVAMRINGEDCKALAAERADYLNRIILLEPSYYAANEYLSVATEKTDAIDNARRVRKKLSRGVSTAEHKAVNKILIAILLATIAVFTIGMPLVFSVMRGLVQQNFSLSPFGIFTNFYAQSLFEAFFNVFFLFGVYGLMQIIKPASDYVVKRVWIKRTIALWTLAVVFAVVYSIVWNYFKSMLLQAFNYDFLTYELPYIFLLAAELCVLVSLANEIIKFIMHELPSRSTADNYRRFVCGYKRAMLGYVVDGVLLVVDILGAYLLYGWYKSVGHGSILLLGQTVFYIFAGLTAAVVIAKLVYLTVRYFGIRKRYGKNTAN